MQLFLDTANVEQIRKSAGLGIISGVTTNPSLISKEGTKDYKSVIQEICSIVPGSVSVEVISQDMEGMVDEARELASWADNVAVKIPVTWEGIQAISVLSKEGINVNMTLCFSVNQALLGALAGATFVSPFVGRLDDAGHDGMALIEDIVQVYDQYDFDTMVLAASIRNPLHVVTAAMAGAHISTVPYGVLEQMMRHPLTDAGIDKFLADWGKLQG
ncbi:fructose-6-phosphate aldolase [Chloroflexota bacterium]